jgi:hypothetical protein
MRSYNTKRLLYQLLDLCHVCSFYLDRPAQRPNRESTAQQALDLRGIRHVTHKRHLFRRGKTAASISEILCEPSDLFL